jgi:alanine racemase
MSSSARVLQLSAEQADLLAKLAQHAMSAEAATAVLSSAPVRLSAEVLAVKRVPAGAGVSYGHTFRTEKPTTLVLVAMGYGHGIPRKAGNRAHVTWNGVRMPIVGRVAMDVMVVDAGSAAVNAGDRVVVFGEAEGEIPLGEWANSVGEHPLSVVAALDHRVAREVLS